MAFILIFGVASSVLDARPTTSARRFTFEIPALGPNDPFEMKRVQTQNQTPTAVFIHRQTVELYRQIKNPFSSVSVHVVLV